MQIKSSKKTKLAALLVASLALLSGGSYVAWIAAAPWVHDATLDPSNNSTTRLIRETAESPAQTNTLYIPAIDMSIPFASGSADVLDHNAWWRHPENGSPVGGNFVLAAHRFELAPTPAETRRKSPLYSVHRLKDGDKIIADYNGERYTYTIGKIYRVKPTDIQIEDRTENPQLTLYTCTLNGSSDGRDVIIAYPDVN